MIIRHDGNTCLFITQPDHARLASSLLTAWSTAAFAAHPRRDTILFATREHDNGWIEEDAETLVDPTGDPLDFIAAPDAVKHRIWPRAVGRLAADHPYEAALVAEHALAIHRQHRSNSAWRRFFDTMDAQRAALLGRCGSWAGAMIDADYAFLNIADLLSLIFCNGWRDPFEHEGRRILLTGTKLVVDPDPFDTVRVPLRVLARRLPVRRYASSAELRASLDVAPLEFLEGEAVGKHGNGRE